MNDHLIKSKTALQLILILLISFTDLYGQKNAHMEKKLQAAASRNDTTAIRGLLEEDINIDARDSQKRTPLMLATYKNNIKAAKLLINAGADVNAQDDNLTSPFLYAGANGYLKILKASLGSGRVDYNVVNRYGGTALIPACERGHIDIVQELLKLDRYPIDHINHLGWTALLEAIILSDGGPPHQKIVQLLVDSGADISIADNDGITPLMHAREKGYTEIVDILTKAKAQEYDND